MIWRFVFCFFISKVLFICIWGTEVFVIPLERIHKTSLKKKKKKHYESPLYLVVRVSNTDHFYPTLMRTAEAKEFHLKCYIKTAHSFFSDSGGIWGFFQSQAYFVAICQSLICEQRWMSCLGEFDGSQWRIIFSDVWNCQGSWVGGLCASEEVVYHAAAGTP